MSGEHIASAIHTANPIGVAVRDQTKVSWFRLQCGLAACVVALDWLRAYSPKIWIMLCIECAYFAVGFFKQLLKAPCPNAIKCVVRKSQSRSSDKLKINHSTKGVEIAGFEILNL